MWSTLTWKKIIYDANAISWKITTLRALGAWFNNVMYLVGVGVAIPTQVIRLSCICFIFHIKNVYIELVLRSLHCSTSYSFRTCHGICYPICLLCRYGRYMMDGPMEIVLPLWKIHDGWTHGDCSAIMEDTWWMDPWRLFCHYGRYMMVGPMEITLPLWKIHDEWTHGDYSAIMEDTWWMDPWR